MANKSIFADAQNGLLRNLKPIDLIGFMQIVFDKYEENEIAKFQPANMFVDEYFNWNPIQMGLTAEALMGQYGFRIMASVIGNNSDTPLRGSKGFSAWTHEIPRIGHKFPMEASKLRQLYQVLESVRTTEEAKVKQLQKTIFANVQDAYLGCKDTLDYIFLHALFHEGKVEFTSKLNNPQGPAKFSLDYNMPDENKLKTKTAWTTDNALAGNLRIFEELQNIVTTMQNKGIAVGQMLMSEKIFTLIQRDKVVRQMVYGNDRSSALVKLSDLNAALTDYGLPPIRKVNRKMAIEKDGKPSLVNPLLDDDKDSERIVFIPEGKLGEMQPAVEDSDLIPEENVSYINSNDGIKVSQWSVGDSTGQKPTEYTQAAGRVLPIITEIKGIYSLRVTNI